ncbi:hypothetical protein, partial [Photobacterium minamisatsumaniensis]|uniref:class III lanthionine synthetase LanKC N-terminal domain-containing protein n=1 Tax=Photobacterium minamisatsumaniensis TaxID=2910233 RepID=UPI003D113E98
MTIDKIYEEHLKDWYSFTSTLPFPKKKVWMYHHPNIEHLPIQGWKIHISAYPACTLAIAKILVKFLVKENISFKFFHNLTDYYQINAGIGSNYTQIGKFFTIYPLDYNEFILIIIQLVKILEGFSGPKVVFDNHIPDTCIYYRYGIIKGTKKTKIVDSDGNLYDDDRTIYKPSWVNDPLGEEISISKTVRGDNRKIPSHYRIMSVLSQRGKGGVYEAFDNNKKCTVIIKEGRRHGERDLFGVSGFDRIMNEVVFYKKFSHYGYLPELMDYFTIGDCAYIVIEKISNINESEITKGYLKLNWPSLDNFINKVHKCGYIFRDIK